MAEVLLIKWAGEDSPWRVNLRQAYLTDNKHLFDT